MGFLGLLIGIIVAIIVLCQGDRPAKNQAQTEEELFQRIMRYGTEEQMEIARMYKANNDLAALQTLVLFDIFFL